MKAIKLAPNDDNTFRFTTHSTREARPAPEPGLRGICPATEVEGEVRRLRAEGREVTVTGPAVAALRRAGIDAGPWSEPEETTKSIEQLEQANDEAVTAREAALDAKLRATTRGVTAEEAAALQAEVTRTAEAARLAGDALSAAYRAERDR